MGKQYQRSDSGLYVPKGSIRGSVQDIKVFENYGTSRQKMVDYNKGGENTISSGASYNLLANSFFANGTNNNASGATARYTDANNIQFPSWADLSGSTFPNSSSSYGEYMSPWATTFGSIAGIKGGSGGLGSHVTTLTSAQLAWQLKNSNAQTYDFASPNSLWTQNGQITFSGSTQITASGIPSIAVTLTITSSNTAQAYTIDSIGWLPVKTVNITNNYYWTGNAGVAPSDNTSAPVYSSQNTSPSSITNLCVSALFVLPYLVTVNANGAIQFTYTFQGA